MIRTKRLFYVLIAIGVLCLIIAAWTTPAKPTSDYTLGDRFLMTAGILIVTGGIGWFLTCMCEETT